MVVKYRIISNELTIRIIGSLELYNIQEAFRKVTKVFDGSKKIVLDLIGVTDADSSSLQLLYHLKHRTANEGGVIERIESSDAIRHIISQYEMGHLFDQTPEIMTGSDEKDTMKR